jgi:hypothetical protein
MDGYHKKLGIGLINLLIKYEKNPLRGSEPLRG